MFDENDSWMTSLLNNSVEFEESVKEIEKEIELEKKNADKISTSERLTDQTVIENKIIEPILEAVSVPKIEKKSKKSVSFGVIDFFDKNNNHRSHGWVV